MIEETVAKIEAALREARLADPKNKAELIALLEKLKAEVQREKRSKDLLAAVDSKLKDAAVEFDVTHPQLAAVIGEVSMLLSKIGI
ncbi:MAG: DUF4404 family protein [Elusimicrobia bacterium]|nr:DUF4404 family protein [Elusimicrobiota bacterium]